MNGSLTMYKTKQIVQHDIQMDLLNCMYKMKNIHTARNGVLERSSSDHVSSANKNWDIFDQVKQFLKNNQDLHAMAELEAKQKEILEQLAQLKQQLLSIKAELKTSPTPATRSQSQYTASTENSIQCNGHPDIIVNASPEFPPYSLELLQKLLKDTVRLSVKIYTHSTVSSLPLEAVAFTNTVENFQQANCSLPEINIRLIWKNVGADPQIMLTPLPITGEVNLLRYFARICTGNLNYEKQPKPQEIDSLLDSISILVRTRTKTEKKSFLQKLNQMVDKTQWLAGRKHPTIADFATYSAVKQVNCEISAHLTKWMKRVESL